MLSNNQVFRANTNTEKEEKLNSTEEDYLEQRQDYTQIVLFISVILKKSAHFNKILVINQAVQTFGARLAF
jgi:hypothetical protein